MTIKALLVDLDGVIRRWHSTDEELEIRAGLPVGSIRKIALSGGLIQKVIAGEISDEDWRLAITRELDCLYSPSNGAAWIVEEWSRPIGEVDQETLGLLRRCKESVRRVLVTNATSRVERDLEALGLTAEFYRVINSSAVKCVKPEREIYEIALKCAESRADEALFVDDTPENVEAAERIGLRGHVFTGTEGLRAFLAQAGVLESDQA